MNFHRQSDKPGNPLGFFIYQVDSIKSFPLAIESDFSFLQDELLAKQISLIKHLAAKINAIFAREVYDKVITEIEEIPIKRALLANASEAIQAYTEKYARLEQEITALRPLNT